MKNVWEVSIVPKLKIGARMESRNGAQYELISFDDSGFIIQRPETKSTVKITKRQVLKTIQRLEQGEHLQFQKNPSQGGISYTVAKEIGVVWALGDFVRTVSDGYVAGDAFEKPQPEDYLWLPYVNVSEDIQPKKSNPSTYDPDAHGLGWSEHNRTQNNLAAFLQRHNVYPKTPKSPPFYDIAWKKDDKIFVAEVKSITAQNEESQLRKGLGQVLRYKYQLKGKKEVCAVLVASRMPQDFSWIETCADVDVLLIWPESFQNLIQNPPHQET